MLFINCTQHSMTAEQIEAVEDFMFENELPFNGEIVNLKDVNPELFAKLANTPEDDLERGHLVKEFADYINETDAMFHLPIGSPAFMFELASFLQWRFDFSNGEKTYKICMSHTKRESIEKDGVKTSVFKFERFIRVE